MRRMLKRVSSSHLGEDIEGNSQDIVHAGYLKKLNSKGKKWQKRWFALYTDSTMRYFLKDTSSYPRGSINLKCATSVHENFVANAASPHVVNIVTKERTYHLGAESQLESRKWVDAIRDITNISVELQLKNLFKSLGIDLSLVEEFVKEGILVSDILKLPPEELKLLIPQAGPRNRLIHHLLGKDEEQETTKNKVRTLQDACLSGDVALVEELLGYNKSAVNSPDENGVYPLHNAIRGQHLRIVQILAENDVDFDLRTDSNLSPRAFACESGALSCIPFLIESTGGDPNEIENDEDRLTLLHYAAIDNHAIVGTILIDMNANIEATSSEGRTPLHYASMENSIETLEVLIHHGALPNVRDNNLDTPLHLAKSSAASFYLVSNGARVGLAGSICSSGAEFNADEMKTAAEVYASLPGATEHYYAVDKQKWIADDAFDSCMICQQNFSVKIRKHHCRRCGTLCCADCSTKKITFSSDKKKPKPERACDGCFLAMHYKTRTNKRRHSSYTETPTTHHDQEIYSERTRLKTEEEIFSPISGDGDTDVETRGANVSRSSANSSDEFMISKDSTEETNLPISSA